MYEINNKEIGNLKTQIDILGKQNDLHENTINEQRNLIKDTDALLNKTQNDLNEMTDLFMFQYSTRVFWKTTTIVGIPVSIGVGAILANKFLKK